MCAQVCLGLYIPNPLTLSVWSFTDIEFSLSLSLVYMHYSPETPGTEKQEGIL